VPISRELYQASCGIEGFLDKGGEKEMESIVGVFALSSAICCHLISKTHHGVTRSWVTNKWFWAGFFGSLPALVAFLAHVYLSRGRSN